ncbi:MAG: hypothetical protein K2X03_10365 [Bryobacteraceae bacterium]|nr:hypothetical protein [Bryobacteraceae bacterium]
MTEAMAKAVAEFRAAAERLLAEVERQEEELARLRPLPGDDLKQIYGIGPVLEGRLRGLGIERFEQIANWDDAAIDAFQQQLPEYPGRIRREAWVKSARDAYRKKYKPGR